MCVCAADVPREHKRGTSPLPPYVNWVEKGAVNPPKDQVNLARIHVVASLDGITHVVIRVSAVPAGRSVPWRPLRVPGAPSYVFHSPVMFDFLFFFLQVRDV